MSALQAAQVYTNGLNLKFNKTIKVSTITNSAFRLYANLSTPVSIPFEEIVLNRDYNSISRSITLHFKTTLLTGIQYRLTVSGLKDATGTTIADFNYDFYPQAGSESVNTLESLESEPVEIIDRSEQSLAFMSNESIVASNPDFYIVSTDPENSEIYLDPEYNSGRVTIVFSATPTASCLNNKYFKAYRKKIQRSASKWELLPIKVSANHTKPYVYLDFPSTDATPVYVTPDKTYFQSGYKYRIVISGDVGI